MIQSSKCEVQTVSYANTHNGFVLGFAETFKTLDLGNGFMFAIDNQYMSEDDDFGISVTIAEDAIEQCSSANITSIVPTENLEWRHTNDDQVRHFAVHTDSNLLGIVSIFNLHSIEFVSRRVIVKTQAGSNTFFL